MTPDQEQRLITAVQNYSDLIDTLHGPQDTDLVDELIRLFNGNAGKLTEQLEGNDMARGRKKKEPQTSDLKAIGDEMMHPTQPMQQPAAAHVALPSDRTQLITEWKQAADQLKEIKAKENALRQALVSQITDATKLEGTETVDIGWGYALKVTKEQNYTATNKEGEVEKLVEELSARGEDAAKLADALIRWQPDVAKRPYREVLRIAQQYNDETILKLLHAAITVKPGMPQLEMVAPGEQTQESPATSQPPVYVLEQNFSPE